MESDKTVQSYRKGRNKLVMFDDVDVGFMVELKRGEMRNVASMDQVIAGRRIVYHGRA